MWLHLARQRRPGSPSAARKALRMYWPDETAPSILDGTWRIPRVHAAD